MREKDIDNNRRMSFFQKLYSKLDIPPDVVNGIFVEIRGKSNVCVHGCREILLYTPEEVRVRMSGCVLSVKGLSLYCTAYHSGNAEIDGIIDSVSFAEEV